MTSSDLQTSARDLAYQWTRDAILNGYFPEGSFLEEKVVVEKTGVSRTPVREALHRLAAERFVELLPRRGAQVRRTTAAELFETYEMRTVLEGHAFRVLCEQRLPIPDMSAHLDEMEDPDRLVEIMAGNRAVIADHALRDYEFHFSFVQATGNSVLIDLYSSLRSRYQRIGVNAVALRPSRMSVILPQHRAIFETLQRHDFQGAIELLREHLRPDAAVVSGLN
jgi:DNA-binding GntR family transcriptional regulator